MKDDANDKQLLLLRWVDGDLSIQERAHVETLLRSDPAARALLREIAEQAVVFADLERMATAAPAIGTTTLPIDSSRGSVTGALSAESEPDERTEGGPTSPVVVSSLFSARPAFALAALSLIALVGTIGWVLVRQGIVRDAERPLIAITGASGSLQWTGDGGHVRVGVEVEQTFGAGTLESLSADSWVTFRYEDGTEIGLLGNSSVTIAGEMDGQSQKLIYVRRGNVSANVSAQPRGRPMMVQTPTASMEVLGTQFNVDSESSMTVLTVNEGCVRCTRLADGLVEEVPARHRLVAAASRQGAFRAVAQQTAANHWKSRLPLGIEYGKWLPASGDQAAGLRAMPMLWRDHKNDHRQRVLLYIASLSVSRGEQSPVVPRAGARLRVRGRIESPRDVIFGLTTQHLHGGCAGKYLTRRPVAAFDPQGGEFVFDLEIEEFEPSERGQPESSIGLRLHDCWCLTIDEDAGLTIDGVELLWADGTTDETPDNAPDVRTLLPSLAPTPGEAEEGRSERRTR